MICSWIKHLVDTLKFASCVKINESALFLFQKNWIRQEMTWAFLRFRRGASRPSVYDQLWQCCLNIAKFWVNGSCWEVHSKQRQYLGKMRTHSTWFWHIQFGKEHHLYWILRIGQWSCLKDLVRFYTAYIVYHRLCTGWGLSSTGLELWHLGKTCCEPACYPPRYISLYFL